MSHKLHSNARTTPKLREEIHHAEGSAAALARRYNVTAPTIIKWQGRDDFTDRSHRPHKLNTTLSEAEETLVVVLRQALLLPLDDLVAVTREFINPVASRSAIARLLVREGLNDLKAMQAAIVPVEESQKPKGKGFKDYEPGYLHVDIKYLPKMPDQDKHGYLFVAIDRATRWVFLKVYADQTQQSSVDFLRQLHLRCPVKISKLLTDNGTQFTDRFTSQEKKPTGTHAFDQTCTALDIEHRLIPPRTPQMNGMVERFNGRISELVKQTRFTSAAHLHTTLDNYCKVYNHHIPQKALGFISPVDALKQWHEKKPELFLRNVYKQAKLDNYKSLSLQL